MTTDSWQSIANMIATANGVARRNDETPASEKDACAGFRLCLLLLLHAPEEIGALAGRVNQEDHNKLEPELVHFCLKALRNERD